jgi:hypothetical protein
LPQSFIDDVTLSKEFGSCYKVPVPVSVADPGSGAFLPGYASGMNYLIDYEKKEFFMLHTSLGCRIPDEEKFGSGSGMEKCSYPDPQCW